MKIILIFVLTVIVFACEGVSNKVGKYQHVLVKRIITGDSLILTKFGKIDEDIKVHLYGIRSPNLDEDYGSDARKHLIMLLEKYKENKLEFVSKRKRDDGDIIYGRLYAGRHNLIKDMLMGGYASCYHGKRCARSYIHLVKQAKARGVGMWKKVKAVMPKKESSKKQKALLKLEKNVEYSVVLKKISDGDTISVAMDSSKDSPVIKVRMSGIDTPEMKQSFGVEARNHLQNIFDKVKNESVTLVVLGRDMYGRTLGIVKSGSKDINRQMVSDGFAWCYRLTKCPQSYISAAKEARIKKKGLFVQTNPVSPWDWRKQKKLSKSTLKTDLR